MAIQQQFVEAIKLLSCYKELIALNNLENKNAIDFALSANMLEVADMLKNMLTFDSNKASKLSKDKVNTSPDKKLTSQIAKRKEDNNLYRKIKREMLEVSDIMVKGIHREEGIDCAILETPFSFTNAANIDKSSYISKDIR